MCYLRGLRPAVVEAHRGSCLSVVVPECVTNIKAFTRYAEVIRDETKKRGKERRYKSRAEEKQEARKWRVEKMTEAREKSKEEKDSEIQRVFRGVWCFVLGL
jgi:septal ring factor EnvC (AmiA/AmiB activator)